MDETNFDVKGFLAQAFEQAPEYIKSFIISEKYNAFLEEVRVAGNFHVDVIGNISDEILMMLLGMAEPRDLPDNLKREAGLTDAQIALTIERANQSVFIPLQEQMRAEQKVAPIPPPETSRPPLVPPPHIPASILPAPAPILVAPTPVPIPPTPVPPPPPPVTAPAPVPSVPHTPPAPVVEATMRTMEHDVESMKDGVVPEPVPYHIPQSTSVPGYPPLARDLAALPDPTRPAPAPGAVEKPLVQSAPVQQPSAPKPTVSAPPPVVSPVQTVPSFAKDSAALPAPVLSSAPSVQGASVPTATEIENSLKQYGIDPYREAVE